MFRVVLISVAVALFSISVAGTNVNRCKKGEPFPLSVDVLGCDQPPCAVVKGGIAVMEVHFVGTKNDIRKLTAVVHGSALGITVPYVLPEDVSDVCSNLMYDATCPLYDTEDVVYKFNFYIDYIYPEIGVKVQLSLVDEYDESIACFICDIKVKKGEVVPNDVDVDAA